MVHVGRLVVRVRETGSASCCCDCSSAISRYCIIQKGKAGLGCLQVLYKFAVLRGISLVLALRNSLKHVMLLPEPSLIHHSRALNACAEPPNVRDMLNSIR